MRAIILVALLACSTLMVPLTVLAAEQFLNRPCVPQFGSDFNSGFNGMHDAQAKPRLNEPGSGGGGAGVI